MRKRQKLSLNQYFEGILSQNTVILSQAITLIESNLKSDQKLAQELIDKVLPYTGKSKRIGITGVPGVGKSTFIEVFGKYLTNLDKKIAILTIDPSSQRSKGSILGDKTRMAELANDKNAYIRPSPTKSTLGGIAQKTRETLLLCEAAGYEIIFIETVGVGQSETLVKDLVDFFLLLMLAGAGDELQGIKRGIMEMADGLIITKADGINESKARLAKIEYENALHLFPKNEKEWFPQVLTCSALENQGMKEVWELIQDYFNQMQEQGLIIKNRQEQNLAWLHTNIEKHLKEQFYANPKVKDELPLLEELIQKGKISIQKALERILTL